MLEFQTRPNDCPICGGTVDIPADVFKVTAEMPRMLARSFREPRALSAEGWTPHEVAAHLADVEVGFAWRLRRILTEDEPLLSAFDQDLWAEKLHYPHRDLAGSLALFAANRQSNLELIRHAGESCLERTYRHPEFGRHPLRVLFHHKADHDIAHLRQIRGE